MADGSVFNGLGMGMKAFIAAEVAFNSNFGEMSRKNGAADTKNIMTLSDYMKKENPDKLKNWNPELRDNNKLMTTYVVPMTMPNGERIDIVVNAKGHDIAQIYINEDPKNRFHLDDSVKDKIRMMTEGAIDKNAAYEREFIPKNLDELAEKISKDELIPKTQEDVKKREQQADAKGFAEQEEEEEKTVEEVAKDLGLPPTAVEKFCEDNSIDQNNIKGSNIIQNTSKLQRQLGTKLETPIGANVIALRVNGVEGNTKLAIVGLDGSTLDFNEEHTGERDEEQLLSEICPEGANGTIGQETDEQIKDEIEVEQDEGKVEYEADVNREGNIQYFQDRFNKIKEVIKSAKEGIENDSSLSSAEKARMLADIEIDEYVQLEQLQNETGIQIPELSDKERGEAQAAENEAEVEELKDGIKGVAGGIVKTAAVISSLAEDDQKVHLTPAEEAMKRRGF